MSAEDYNDLSERPCGQLQCCVCDGSNGCSMGCSPSCAHKATIACDVLAAHFTFFWAIVALITNLSTDRDEHGDDKIPIAIHSCAMAAFPIAQVLLAMTTCIKVCSRGCRSACIGDWPHRDWPHYITIGLFWIYLVFVFVSTNTTSPFDMDACWAKCGSECDLKCHSDPNDEWCYEDGGVMECIRDRMIDGWITPMGNCYNSCDDAKNRPLTLIVCAFAILFLLAASLMLVCEKSKISELRGNRASYLTIPIDTDHNTLVDSFHDGNCDLNVQS